MIHSVRRLLIATLPLAALAAAPVATVSIAPLAVISGCPPGETGVTNGCAPFCLPGLVLDMQTGLCVKAPAPPAPPPPPSATVNGMVAPFAV
jgi:hypothetical protein